MTDRIAAVAVPVIRLADGASCARRPNTMMMTTRWMLAAAWIVLAACGDPGDLGVEVLLDARARRDDPDACRAAVVEAISEAIMGEMMAIWGADHLEEFRRSYTAFLEGRQLGADEPTLGWSDAPEVQAAQRALWNDVADRLAAPASGRG